MSAVSFAAMDMPPAGEGRGGRAVERAGAGHWGKDPPHAVTHQGKGRPASTGKPSCLESRREGAPSCLERHPGQLLPSRDQVRRLTCR